MNKYLNFGLIPSIFLLSLAQADENQKLNFTNDMMTSFAQNIDFKTNLIMPLSEKALLLFFTKESQLYFAVMVNNNGLINIGRHLYQYKDNQYFQINVADNVYQLLANFVSNNINGIASLKQNQEISQQISSLLDKNDLSNSTKVSMLTYQFIGEDKLTYEDNIYINETKSESFVFLNKQKRLIQRTIYVVNEETITIEKEKYKTVPGELSLPVGSELHAGESWQTDRLKLVMQHDGNLVLYDLLQNALWSSHTKGLKVVKAVVQKNGLVLYGESPKAIWSSGTSNEANHLKLQKDRNLVLYSNDQKSVWSTGTHTKYDDKIKDAIKKANVDATKKVYVYDTQFRILVDDKNNKYDWENNQVIKMEDTRGYIKEYSYYEKEGLLLDVLVFRAYNYKAR